MNLADHLISKRNDAIQNKACLGFDGFIDSITKLVKQRNHAGYPPEYFTQKQDWANYILSKKTGSFSIELEQQSIKTGGNAPNMASALAKLGIAADCVGAFGYPAIDPLFNTMPQLCSLYSFAAPGVCQAIEFEDGKIMLATTSDLNKSDWATIIKRISIDVLIKIFTEARLIGMLNWGELINSTDYWKGLLHDVLPFCTTGKEKLFIVDLSDCSSRSKDEMLSALELLQAFSAYGKIILSLNHNECIAVYNILFEPMPNNSDIKSLGEKIFTRLQPGILLLHNRTKAIAFSKHEAAEKNSPLIEAPKLLTGAGDNFNAGFCFGQLMDCGLEDSLLLAHLGAAYYIKNGESINRNTLIEELKTV